ncbi:DUF2059 domain-containing protein [Devosia sp.]|uniref:DUF2059 domain-containing protein n=1 Tax=Devosia sp. TaxID=1871048 RepID=UPI003263A8B8
MRLKAFAAIMIGASLMAVSMPAYAQEVGPEQLQLARKYVDLTDRAQIYETTMVEAAVETMRQIVQQNPELSDATNKAISKILEEYKAKKGDLMDQFARVYAVQFTSEELTEIVAFYSTPAGEKLAKTAAQVNGDLSKVLEVFTNNMRQEFFAKVRAELKANGVAL